MIGLWRGRLAIKYLFFEMLPVFLIGVVVFISTILLLQSFRLVERVVIYGADTASVIKVFAYLAISFIPLVLPMSLLFTILMVYGRLSGDSEIVAMKSLGLNTLHLSFPAIILATLTAVLSAQTSFYIAPWGQRQMEVLMAHLGQVRPTVAIREGVFSEGFFNLVVYANEVDSESATLKNVFLYDERESGAPVTIVAKKGQLVREDTASGAKAFMRLMDGNIHRTEESGQVYTKIDFDTYDINLFQANVFSTKEKSPMSYNLGELNLALSRFDLDDKMKRLLEIEFHRRWAISATCMIMAFLGVGLGTKVNRRQGKGSGFVTSVIVIVVYWILQASLENAAKTGTLPVIPAVWATNFLFTGVALWALKRSAQNS